MTTDLIMRVNVRTTTTTIFGNHRGTGLMGTVAVTHSVVVVAVLAALL